MIIRRRQSPWGGKLTTSKPVMILTALLLTISCVSASQGKFHSIPGVRGPKLTIQLDPPVPFDATVIDAPMGDPSQIAFNAADPSLDEPVPFPELGDMAQYGFSATPDASMAATPFVAPSQFDPGTPAAAFYGSGTNPVDNLRAAICLTTAIYYEAASESDDGQRAVAQVILNRVKHPAWPNTVCGVIYQGSDGRVCQFSYACDGSMARTPTREGWARASRIARAALSGYVHRPVGLSTFYHADYVNPLWNRKLIVANITGRHIFYRMPGTVGAPQTFYTSYRGFEPVPAPKPRAYVAAKPAPNVPVPTPIAPQMAGKGAPVPYPGAVTGLAASPNPKLAAQAAAQPVPMPEQRASKAAARTEDSGETYVTPDSEIMPQYRNSGKWIGR
jgi:hypothetical protein